MKKHHEWIIIQNEVVLRRFPKEEERAAREIARQYAVSCVQEVGEEEYFSNKTLAVGLHLVDALK